MTDERGIAKLEAAAQRFGEPLTDWDVEAIEEPQTVAVTPAGAGDAGDRCEIQVERQALVDPLVFALGVSAHAAWFANETLRILDPASDPRIGDPAKHRTLPPSAVASEMFSPRAATAAALSSPLSGLVDWALRFD